ncbi:MAG: chemotaxis protein CheW [Calditrichia bacterium]
MNDPNVLNPHQEEERLSIFELSGKLFGLDITRSREVIPLPRFTALPNSGDIFFGVFNLRGEIFPLIDISPILGLPSKQIQSDDMAILLDGPEELIMAMLADKIYSVLTYTDAEIKPAKGVISPKLESFTKGILEHEESLIHLLDLDSIFNTKDLLAHF